MPKISGANLQEHRVATNERLLDSYGELVMAKGYNEVSLAEVAAQAGVSRTAVYNYFSDRESLLFAWTDREVDKSLTGLRQDVAAALSHADKLSAFIRHQITAFATSHLPPGREVVHLLGPEAFGRFMAHLEPLEQLLRDILADGIAAGEFVDLDVAATVPLIMGSLGAERAPLSTGRHDLDETLERVTTFVLRSLGAKLPT